MAVDHVADFPGKSEEEGSILFVGCVLRRLRRLRRPRRF